MEQNTPYFEVNGQRYYIFKTRYLIAEYEKRRDEIALSEEDELEYTREQAKQEELQRLSERKDELYEIYLDTFDDVDREKYERACIAYDKLIMQISQMSNVMGKQNKKILDFSEKLIIESLQWDMNGKTIRTIDEATAIWESYVDEVGKFKASEFVIYVINYIIIGDEENDNPFVIQARAKAEEKRNQKKLRAKK